jgi:hypothetical protein
MSLNVRQVIARSGRLHGCWASGDDPTADEAADALVAINSLKRSMFGTLIGPRLGPITLSGTVGQAENGGEYQIPGGAPFTLTAPLNPRSGARFGVVDANLAWGTYQLVINRNGRLINGAATNYAINTAGQNTRFWFRGDTGDWIIEADFASLDSAIEFPDPLIDYLPNMLAVVIAAEYGAEVRPDVAAGALEGRQAFARTYYRRGRNQIDPPIGLVTPGGDQQPARG